MCVCGGVCVCVWGGGGGGVDVYPFIITSTDTFIFPTGSYVKCFQGAAD